MIKGGVLQTASKALQKLLFISRYLTTNAKGFEKEKENNKENKKEKEKGSSRKKK